MIPLDLHKLDIFLTIARHKSFTRAAEALIMTQPTISQQLATLEATLGTQLIDRTTRQLRLTDAGRVLQEQGEALMTQAEALVNAVHSAAGIARQTLRLGVGHTLATYLLPNLLSRFRQSHPEYRVRLAVGNTAELLTQIANQELDLALVGSPVQHSAVLSQPFMQDRLVVIVARDDPWVQQSSIPLEMLLTRVFLTREPGSALYATVARLLGEEKLTGDEVILLGETEAIKRSVELGLGVALIQEIAIKREVEQGRLYAIPLRDADDTRTYLVAHGKQIALKPPAQDFIALLSS
jgi:LysR family transcriptional regulator, low CO2-responsive transcriptional regulator